MFPLNQNPCSICSQLKGYAEIEYEAGADRPNFDPAYDKLKATEPMVRNAAGLLYCPECGQYYLEREWTPGGSDDALRTYHHESISRISHGTAREALARAVAEAKEWMEKYTDYKILGGQYKKEYEDLCAAATIEFQRLKKSTDKP